MKKLSLATLLVTLLAALPASATTFTVEMVADNDFAIFSGTSSGINHLLYQNDFDWPSQIPAVSTLTFNLASGDDTFYVLGMGGGGAEENISGIVNGVNMTDPSVSVQMSSDLSSFLTGYPLNVAEGTYDASLAEVQAAFSSLTWTDASANLNSTQTVIVSAGFGSGFRFDTNTAHLFAFQAEDVNVPVPAPAGALVLLLGLSFLAKRRA